MKNKKLNSTILNHFKKNRLHPDLKLDPDGTLSIIDYSRRSDESQTRTLQIQDFYLPVNSVHTEICSLNDVPAMCIPAIEALSYAASSTPPSKTKCHRLLSAFRMIAKYIEHLWLNDRYCLNQVIKEDCEELGKTLANGGWHEALDIENRLLDALTALELPTPTKNIRRSVKSKVISKFIGTNIGQVEFFKYFELQYQMGFEEHTIVDPKIEEQSKTIITPFKYSNLRNTMDTINLLHYASEEYRISFLPYPNSTVIASKLTEAPGRTADIDGAQAGLMLEASLTMIYQTAPTLLEIIKRAIAIFQENSYTHSTRRDYFKVLSDRIATISVTALEATPYSLSNINTITKLNRIIKDILSACFINIAVFNARRKDEVIHKKFGLHRDCCRQYNHNLNIHEAEFYIEKSAKDYVHFFIGDATTQSIKILQELQTILKLHPSDYDYSKENTLFRFKQFKSDGLSNYIFNYNFVGSRDGHASHFITSYVGDQSGLRVTPHMFRRLYCTIFMNQHEYPHLPALSQQLQHGELAVTQLYITSPTTQNAAANLSKLYDWQIEQYATAHVVHKQDIAKAMIEAKSEKFGEIIFGILNENATSGSYSKFTRNAFKTLQKSTQFQDLDKPELVNTLIEQLQIRGYSPEPFRHSQCMVGSSKLKTRSRCWDKESQVLRKQTSAPELCSRCPFSLTSRAHISNMKADAVTLLKQIESTSAHSLASKLLQHQHNNLCKVILYHESQLEKTYA
jgi:hypothetical protein